MDYQMSNLSGTYKGWDFYDDLVPILLFFYVK